MLHHPSDPLTDLSRAIARATHSSPPLLALWQELRSAQAIWLQTLPASALASFDDAERQLDARQALQNAALRLGLALADAAVAPRPDRPAEAPPPAEPTDAGAHPAPDSAAAVPGQPAALAACADAPSAAPPCEPQSLSPGPTAVPPAPEAAPEPPRPQVTPQVAAAIQASLERNSRLSAASAPHRPDLARDLARSDRELDAVYRAVGRQPRELRTTLQLQTEAGVLHKGMCILEAGAFAGLLPPDRGLVQRWLGARWQVARAAAEALGSVPSGLAGLPQRAQVLRDRCPTPYAVGWGRDHHPQHGDWRADLAQHEQTVRQRLGKDEAEQSLARPLAAAKPLAKPPEQPKEPVPNVAPPEPCPAELLALTRGKRAILLGGDSRPERTQALQSYFEFAELEWAGLPSNDARRLQSFAARLDNHAFDLAIVLQRFSRHKISKVVFDAGKKGVVTPVLAEGYGVVSVRRGLERYLGLG